MKNEILSRTKVFAIDCWKFCKKVPNSREYNAFVNQLIREVQVLLALIIELHNAQNQHWIL